MGQWVLPNLKTDSWSRNDVHLCLSITVECDELLCAGWALWCWQLQTLEEMSPWNWVLSACFLLNQIVTAPLSVCLVKPSVDEYMEFEYGNLNIKCRVVQQRSDWMSCWGSANLHELLAGKWNSGTWTLGADVDESLTFALGRWVSH